MTFPGPNTPLHEQLDALADLLEQLRIQFDGVDLNYAPVNICRDAARTLRLHRNCPQPATPPVPRRRQWVNLNAGYRR